MLAGEVYNCLDPDLDAERQKAKDLIRLYNMTEALPERRTILRQLLGQNLLFLRARRPPGLMFRCIFALVTGQ